MKSCLYCAQDDTIKDEFGYCKKYDCFGRSGKRDELNHLLDEVSHLRDIPDGGGQVSGPVSNFYSLRTRKANDIMYKAVKLFGFVPTEMIEKIPSKNRERWDKNIRW